MRLFAGIAISSDLRNRATQVLSKCARVKADVKWVKPDRLHLTVRFFGEVPVEGLAPLKEALARAALQQGPFQMELGGYGAFPKIGKPRVFFIPVLRGAEPMAVLAAAVTRETEALGLPDPGEEFHPHLTLGRVKSSQGAEDAVRELQQVAPAHLGKMKVERFTLFESRLSSGGAEYQALAENVLSGS
jgi:RNA 2',3'-cyclic 3'-phosphodiesterase